MATGNRLEHSDAPKSIFIPPNQLLKKEPHHCKFDDCLKPRRGYNNFCRQHKAIGKIISGKIAREKAIAKIAARDKSSQVTETNSNYSKLNPCYSSSQIINNEAEDTSAFFLAGIVYFFLTYVLLVDSASPSSKEAQFAGILAVFGTVAIVGCAIKNPIGRVLAGLITVPITVYLLFNIIIESMFSGLGGCFGVCGLSGWSGGGP